VTQQQRLPRDSTIVFEEEEEEDIEDIERGQENEAPEDDQRDTAVYNSAMLA